MKALFPLLLLAGAAVPADHPKTYLLSLGGISVKDTESISSFAIQTWGVTFKSICRIPNGWRIKAGSSATSDGDLAGDGSQGATWFNHGSPKELRNFVLVTLYDRVQQRDIHSADGSGLVPATFKGYATIQSDDGERKFRLTYKNVMLAPASRCPLA
jgi:hypothetical protein